MKIPDHCIVRVIVVGLIILSANADLPAGGNRASGFDATDSTLDAYPPAIWANGSNTTTITVLLIDTNGAPVAGAPVSVASSGSGAPVITPLTATSGVDGAALFTAASTNAGNAVFTATATSNSVVISQTDSVTFVAPPPDLSVYIPDSTVLKTWDSSTGWGDWSKDRTWSIDARTNIVLGKADDPNSQEGWMYINAPAGLSYVNSGMEVTFNLAPKGIDNSHSDHTLLQMLTWDGAFGLGKPRQGFDVWTGGDVTQGNTRQMYADGIYDSNTWDTTPTSIPGLHTMAMLRYASGILETYVDGVLVNTQKTSDPAVPQLQWIGVGYQVSGNWYITRGTIVEKVRAFTYEPELGPVDPDVSTVVASPSSVWADGSARSTITVALHDAATNRIPDKQVTLTRTAGPEGPIISTVSGITGPNGEAIFNVSSTTLGTNEFTVTETTDNPDVLLNQKPSVAFVTTEFLGINVNIDNDLRSGLVGPAGDPGATWNQQLARYGPTASGLLDTNGTATSVGFTRSIPSTGWWGDPALSLLTGSALGEGDLMVTNLPSGKRYDLYIASYCYAYGSKATFATDNVTTNGAIQFCDNGGPEGQSATWDEGQNYVVFKAVEPDTEDRITVTMTRTDPSQNAMLSGFQLVEVVEVSRPRRGLSLIVR